MIKRFQAILQELKLKINKLLHGDSYGSKPHHK